MAIALRREIHFTDSPALLSGMPFSPECPQEGTKLRGSFCIVFGRPAQVAANRPSEPPRVASQKKGARTLERFERPLKLEPASRFAKVSTSHPCRRLRRQDRRRRPPSCRLPLCL